MHNSADAQIRTIKDRKDRGNFCVEANEAKTGSGKCWVYTPLNVHNPHKTLLVTQAYRFDL